MSFWMDYIWSSLNFIIIKERGHIDLCRCELVKPQLRFCCTLITTLLCLISIPSKAQFFEPSDTLDYKRLWISTSIAAAGYAGTIVGLNELWYKDYPRSSFHFFNDNDAWMQMDKMGHALTSYQLGRYGYEVLKWSGVNEKKALWYGGGFGLFFLTTIEVMDGFSSEWGFSAGDAFANVGGIAIFWTQQLVWHEQRMQLKFSYTPSEYANYRPETLGSGGIESVLKDYNGQTIWLSVNPSSFFNNDTPFLPWLNVALGYGANGMLGGSDNPDFNAEGVPLPNFDRYRQFYLSLDIDLTKLPVNSPALKTLFSTIGFIKIPAPAIEFSQGKAHWNWFQF